MKTPYVWIWMSNIISTAILHNTRAVLMHDRQVFISDCIQKLAVTNHRSQLAMVKMRNNIYKT